MDDNKIFKETEQVINITAESKPTVRTNITVYSYDKNTAKFLFRLTKNSTALPMSNSVVISIVLRFGTSGKAVLDAVVEDELEGLVSMVIPEEFLGYEGTVTGGVYINYSNGQSLDCGYFTFSMKRSMIDELTPEMPAYYVEGFENLRVEINEKSQEMKTQLSELDTIFKDLDVYNKAQVDSKVNELKPAIDEVNAQLAQNKYDVLLLNKKVESPNKIEDLIYPIFIPHRGAMGVYQENTMKSYEACVSRGNNLIEMDVQLSKDGSLFVMHDNAIDIKTSGKGLVSDLSTSYLQKVKILDKVGTPTYESGYSPEPIPTVGQVLDRFNKSATYVIESKDNASAIKIASEITDRNLEDYSIIQSFDLNDLKAVEGKNITLMYLNNNVKTSEHTMLKNMGVVFIGVSTTVTGDYITELKNAGFKVIVYTVNHRYLKDKFLSYGVDGFFSDEPFYLDESSPKYVKDTYSEKTFTDGMIPMYGAYKGDFITQPNGKEVWGFAKNSLVADGRDFVLQGQFGKLANVFSMELTINKLQHVDGSWASIAICLQNDYFDDNKNPQLPSGGYHLLFTANGGMQIYEIAPTGAVYLAEYAPGSNEWGAAIDLKLKITVSSSTVVFERLDVPHIVSVSHSMYRGGYVSFGRKNANFVFSDVKVV